MIREYCTGTIQLIDYAGDIVIQLKYKNGPDKQKIIEKWERLYKMQFKRCTVNVIPDTKEICEPEKEETIVVSKEKSSYKKGMNNVSSNGNRISQSRSSGRYW